MATSSSSYITRSDLQKNNNVILGLLSERDTAIAYNKNDIANLRDSIKKLDNGLHYADTVTHLPTDPLDGDLYFFIDVELTPGADPVTGWYFYVGATSSWKNLSSGGGEGTDVDSIHFRGSATALPTDPVKNDMYLFNIENGYQGYYLYRNDEWNYVTDAHNHIEYTDAEIQDFFDMSPEEATIITSIIRDTKISKSLIWSSSKTNTAINDSLATSKKYADDLIKALSSIQLVVCNLLPDEGDSNKVYILKGSDKNVLYVYSNNEWIDVGDFNASMDDYVKTTDLNTTLNGYVKSTDAITVDDFEDEAIDFTSF